MIDGTHEEREEIAATEQELAAEGFSWQIRRARNFEPTHISKEELLERAKSRQSQADKVEQLRIQKAKLDLDVRMKRWKDKIPPAFRDITVKDLPEELRDLCDEWLATPDDQKRTFVLTGPTGVGKTSVLYAISRELYLERQQFLLRTVEKLQEEMRYGADNPQQAYYTAKTCDYFLLDELGAEKRTEAMEEKLDAIFDHRWQWKLPMVFATNIPTTGLRDYFGERAASRLLKGALIYKLEGKDLR